MRPTQDLHVRGMIPLTAPGALKAELPMTEAANRTVFEGREVIKRILLGEDPRMLAIVGPCSIHDPEAAIEYAKRLRAVAAKVESRIIPVMRVYFEKPRTTVGWKGLINDPHLDDTFDIAAGLRSARRILVEINELGLPCASEVLEPIVPQYIADLVTWGAIGARTTESPTHRQMASGLSMPIGYKNGTDGDIQIALDAMNSARTPHAFLGIDGEGQTCVVQTTGNPWGHLILRGGRSGPNYNREFMADTARRLQAEKLSPRIMVDCSHANSNKDPNRQGAVWRDVVRQRVEGNASVMGLMLESHLFAGKQALNGSLSSLKYGVSITDGCIGWEETESLLVEAYEQLEGVVMAAR